MLQKTLDKQLIINRYSQLTMGRKVKYGLISLISWVLWFYSIWVFLGRGSPLALAPVMDEWFWQLFLLLVIAAVCGQGGLVLMWLLLCPPGSVKDNSIYLGAHQKGSIK